MTKPRQNTEPRWARYLASDRKVSAGQVCAKGIRVPVSVILDSLAEGASAADILRSYPTLKPAHVRAAVAYAADLVREEELTPIASDAHQTRRESPRRAG